MKDDFERLARLAKLLGWPKLQAHEHALNEEDTAKLNLQTIRWYTSEIHESFFLQFNVMPSWCGCVYAINYRLCSGWHTFGLFDDDVLMKKEAERLGNYLAFDWVSTLSKRREYRLLHPQCAKYSYKRIRNEGFPKVD
jgi:hypothetical protein